jgi:hypothetical protein
MRVIYIAAGVVALALIAVALVTFSSSKDTPEATKKAQELTAKLQAAGLTAPAMDDLTRLYGSDGGELCQDPGGSLGTSLAKVDLSNGAAGPGQRPVIVPTSVVAGEALAIQVYCPDQLPAFAKYVNGLDFAQVASKNQ